VRIEVSCRQPYLASSPGPSPPGTGDGPGAGGGALLVTIGLPPVTQTAGVKPTTQTRNASVTSFQTPVTSSRPMATSSPPPVRMTHT
jgi:hypothetical protein